MCLFMSEVLDDRWHVFVLFSLVFFLRLGLVVYILVLVSRLRFSVSCDFLKYLLWLLAALGPTVSVHLSYEIQGLELWF